MRQMDLMRKILPITFLLISITVQCVGQGDSAAKAQQLIRLEQSLADALPGDSATWDKYLDPAWYVTTEDGTGKEAFCDR
jgi:hypothetical protein